MALRIVQISDLHLTSREDKRCLGSPVWPSFRRALTWIAEQAGPVDRLVLTGDLAHQRRPETYRRLRAALEPWHDRLLAVPGNHDDRSMFLGAFADRVLPDRATANFVDHVSGCRLVGLDTLQQGRMHGRLGDEQLAWLESVLTADDAPTLVFLHHPPVRVGSWWLDKDRVRDAARLATAVTARVEAIFTGHVHQDHQASLAGVPVLTCPSTAYQFRPGSTIPGSTQRGQPALRIIDWDGARQSSRVVRLGRS